MSDQNASNTASNTNAANMVPMQRRATDSIVGGGRSSGNTTAAASSDEMVNAVNQNERTSASSATPQANRLTDAELPPPINLHALMFSSIQSIARDPTFAPVLRRAASVPDKRTVPPQTRVNKWLQDQAQESAHPEGVKDQEPDYGDHDAEQDGEAEPTD